jgi:hypothetical protein
MVSGVLSAIGRAKRFTAENEHHRSIGGTYKERYRLSRKSRIGVVKKVDTAKTIVIGYDYMLISD